MMRCVIFFWILPVLLLVSMPPAARGGGHEFSRQSASGLTLLQAVHQTLARQPNIKLAEQEVAGSAAELTQAEGRFDLFVKSSVDYQDSYQPLTRQQRKATGESANQQGVGEFTLGLNQELVNGILLQPSLSITRTDDQSFGLETQNQASVNFDLIVPLQKGWGRDVAQSGIHSAQASLESSRYRLQHTTAQTLKEMISAYWAYVSALRKLTIMENIVARAQQGVTEMTELIRAGEKPAADLGPLQANLADKKFSLIQARQALVDARNNLKIAMGLKRDEAISLPLDSFPAVIDSRVMQQTSGDSLAGLACRMRRDLKAESRNQQAIEYSLVGAENDLKPRLDLVFSLGYNGLDEGGGWKDTAHSLNSRVEGANCGVALHFQHSLQNRGAQGQWAQLQAKLQQARISTSDLERRIVSRVEVAFTALQNSLKNLAYSHESVKVYRQVVANETEKVRLGMSTVIDLLAMTDKLESAQLSEVENQRAYADALVTLRYETGSLVSWEGDRSFVSRKQLTTIPTVDTGEK
jgi:outer membrane protein TolC